MKLGAASIPDASLDMSKDFGGVNSISNAPDTNVPKVNKHKWNLPQTQFGNKTLSSKVNIDQVNDLYK